MSIIGGINIFRDSLTNCYDASSNRSYTGFGSNWIDLITFNKMSSFSPTKLNDIGINFSGSASANFSFTQNPNQTFEWWQKIYTTGSSVQNQFESPPIFKIGTYSSASSLIIWDWHNALNLHNIRMLVANPSVWTDSFAIANPYTDMEWTGQYKHCVLIFTGVSKWENIKFYINQNLIFGGNFATPFPSGSIAGGTGITLSVTNGGSLNNDYSIMRIYNKALTDTEIRQNFNASRGKFQL